jgi:hypothetical protein
MKFVPGDATAQWMAISLEGGDPASVLDRIEIPGEFRNKIAEKLTPGSTIIIGERSIDSAILPEGDDFLVLTKDTPELVAARPKAKVKQAKAAPAAKRRQRTARRYTHANPYLVGPRRVEQFRLKTRPASPIPVRGSNAGRVRPYPRKTPIGVQSSALSPPSGQSHFFAQQRGWHAVSSHPVAAALEC